MDKMMQTPRFRVLLALLLGVLFALSLASLRSFPAPFDDEGFYGAYGHGYVTTGKFQSPALRNIGPFVNGNGWNPRVQAGLFGIAGFVFGHSLEVGRAVSLVFIWLAILLWFFIAERLGFSGWLGALAFGATERVFYSSHVLRPESAMVFFNTVLIWWIVKNEKATASSSFARGLFNAPLVMAHGNGLVSAFLGAGEWLAGVWRNARATRLVLFFAVGSLLAVLLFYFAQFYSVGGWGVARAQLEFYANYQVKPNFWQSILNDFRYRWGLELIDVGGSVLAKTIRWFFYLTVFAVSIHSLTKERSPKKFALLALGGVVGYMVLVPDKIDIHLSELMPFFWASIFVWCKTEKKKHAYILVSALVASQLLLCFHHALKYRGETSRDRQAGAVEAFLRSDEGKAFLSKGPIIMTGGMHFWFLFKDRFRFVGQRYIDEVPNLKGRVLAIAQAADTAVLRKCKTMYRDPEGIYTALDCD